MERRSPEHLLLLLVLLVQAPQLLPPMLLLLHLLLHDLLQLQRLVHGQLCRLMQGSRPGRLHEPTAAVRCNNGFCSWSCSCSMLHLRGEPLLEREN